MNKARGKLGKSCEWKSSYFTDCLKQAKKGQMVRCDEAFQEFVASLRVVHWSHELSGDYKEAEVQALKWSAADMKESKKVRKLRKIGVPGRGRLTPLAVEVVR